jgi:hypothetical protein
MQVIHSYEAHRRPNRASDEHRAAVSLVIRRGVTKLRVRAIEERLFVIGKASDCDLVLGDSQFADYHAYILQRGGHITLRHLGAAPHVTVNQRWIRWGELMHGDRIRTGPYEFVLRVCPRLPAENPDKHPNPNALENLSIFNGVSSTASQGTSDHNYEPISWVDGRPPQTPLFPLECAWNDIPGLSRLKDWW